MTTHISHTAGSSAVKTAADLLKDVLQRRDAADAQLTEVTMAISAKRRAMNSAGRKERFKEAATLQGEITALTSQQAEIKATLKALRDEQKKVSSTVVSGIFQDRGYRQQMVTVTRVTVGNPLTGESDSAVYVDENAIITLDIGNEHFEREPRNLKLWVERRGFVLDRQTKEVQI